MNTRVRTYDLKQDIAGREALALLLLPLGDTTLSHRGTHGRHAELGQRMSPCGDVETWMVA